ncbi:MAG: Ig domain-containing protein [Acutalibacteraceae bacterium]
MKKRVLSLILCGVLLFSSLPLTPFGDWYAIEAAAVDTGELEKVFAQVPPKDQWEQYVDTALLSAYYTTALAILRNPDNFSQEEIDGCASSLRSAIDGLKLHTQDIFLSADTLSVAVGKSATLKATLNPENAGDPVTWTSGNSKVVSVEKNSDLEVLLTVHSYAANGVVITASSNGHKATCTVKTLNPLASVKLSNSSISLYKGQSKTLLAQPVGTDSSALPTGDVFYAWNTSNPAIATVSDSGAVTAVAPGTCKVSVTASDGEGKSYTASCTVTVNETVHITTLTPITVTTDGNLYMTVNQTETFRVTVLPTNASVKTLTWKSADSSIVAVSDAKVSGSTASALLTAKAPGKVKITYSATDGSGKSGSFTVVVRPLVSALSFAESVKVLTLTSSGERLTINVTPEDAGNQVVQFTSSDPTVCDVDKDGVLYPKAKGVCTVTAVTTDGTDISTSCTVRVAAKAATVLLNKSAVTVDTGKTYALTATVTDVDGAVYNDVKWTSGDTKIATVDSKGVVTGKYPGKVVIKATALDGSAKNATCVVTVNQPVESVSLPLEETVSVGGTVTITPTIKPAYASNTAVTWSSSDESIATVSTAGVVTGKKIGTVRITCRTEDGGLTASCAVSVVIAAEGITLNKETLILPAGYTYRLTATVKPESATNKTVEWSSSDRSVATVDANGLISGVAGGKCTITARSVSGNYTASCAVTVTQDASGVTLDKTSAGMYVGQVMSLTATVLPLTATNRNVSWSSSNKSIVTVTQQGKLTALSKGTAIITAKTENGGHTATCAITVTDKIPVTGLELETGSLEVFKGEKTAILATVLPANASEKGITWTTSNKSIATVNAAGVITAVATGDAVITATTVDGNFRQQCKITVVQPVSGITLDQSNVKIARGKSKTLKATIAPADATNKKIEWISSDPSVVTVTSSGVVTAKGEGNATVTATTLDGGYSATCNFNVYVAVSGVKINAETIKLPKGEKRIITATVLPTDAANKEVTWESSNTKIVTVNEVGQLTGKTKGTAKITATTKDGAFTASCIVEVVQLATAVKTDFTSITIDAGKSKTLTASVYPSTASDTSLKWKSSNTKVVKVSSAGVITGVAAGTATITITSGDGAASVYCKVTVEQPATGISIPEKASVGIGKKVTLKATLQPANATNKNVSWKSSDTSIVKVSSAGVISGVKAGKATITATTMDGKYKDTCTVTVYVPVSSVKLNKTSTTLKMGSTTTLVPTFTPSNATIKTVTWTSSNYDVATVDAGGKVTPKSVGYAVITATTKDGGLKATCKVNVVNPVKSISLNKTGIRIDPKVTYTLKATISPANATDKRVIWTSSNTKVAKVSSTGVVTGVAVGSAVITAQSTDGGFKATCKVVVANKVKSVSLSRTTAKLYLGKSFTLTATITPSNATNKNLTWTSSNTKVAKVSSKGVVSAVAPGNVTITVKTADGGYTAQCVVAVKRPAQSITLNKSTLTLNSNKTYTLQPTILPANTTDKTVKWTTSNAKVLKVSAKGVVTPVGKGTATVTATTENGLTASCKITVNQVVTGVSVTASASVYTGSKVTLKASVVPSNANNTKVTWSTSDSKIATVDAKGVVTGVKAGKATVTVKTADGGYTAKCTVTVKQHVTSIKLDKTNVSIARGEQTKLTVTYLPSDATTKTCTFASSDSSVISVDSAGNIKALAVGTAVVTATSKDGAKTAKCTFTVVEPAKSISLDKTAITMYNGKAFQLKATVLPENATDKTILWQSGDKNVATVSSDGLVQARGKGTTYITAKMKSNTSLIAVCKVTVYLGVEDIATDQEEYSLYEGEELTIKAGVVPADAQNPTLLWQSSDENIVSVDENGKITAKTLGSAEITVTSEDNSSVSKKLKINVLRAVTGVTLDTVQKTVNNGDSFTLKATVAPESASHKTVTWESSDEAVATVASDGTVTAVAGGEAVITARAENGMSAECQVKVIQRATKVVFPEDSYVMSLDGSLALVTEVLPENTVDKSLVWKVSDSDKASVDQNGLVTAKNTGEVTVTAESVSGTASAAVKITIIKTAEKINIKGAPESIWVGSSAALTAEVLPENTTDKSVTWSVSDPALASVSEKGVVKALASGKVTVTAMAVGGLVSASVEIELRQGAQEITLTPESKSLNVGASVTLTPTVLPMNAYDKSVSWSSSDDRIASVDENGTVTSHKTGTVTITATSKAQKSVSGVCTVKVYKLAEKVTLNSSSVTMKKGGTYKLSAVVSPEDTTDKTVSWSSSDSKIVTVDASGKLTAVSGGVATVTAQSVTEGIYAQCKVTVDVKSESVTLSQTSAAIYAGETLKLTAKLLPADTLDQTLIWTSSDEGVAAVENGVVSAKTAGTVTVSAKTVDTGISAQCQITVKQHVESVSMSQDSLDLYLGKPVLLKADISPANATDKTLIWQTSDSLVATVKNGVVTPVRRGSAVISARSADGDHFAFCVVNVLQGLESIAFSHDSETINQGESLTLVPKLSPTDADDNTLVWTSSDSSVATVVNGVVTAAGKSGTVTVRAAAKGNSSIYAECRITVREPVNSVTISSSELTLEVGKSAELTASLLPENATDKTVIWTSADETVATVKDGVVTALKAGTVEITVTAVYGGASAKCRVTVTQPE